MPNDGTTTRNSVIQKVQNRNNMADMYLRRQMDEFKKHLTLKVLAIEMERLEWHTFLKDLRKCDSDDLTEFVPLLIDEFGEGEYTQRVRKLKTRFRDLFSAVELGLKDERLSMDYVKIREDGEQAQKDHRMVKTELKNRTKPPPPEPERNQQSPLKPLSRNEVSKSTGFITTMASPGIDQVAQANRPQALGVNKFKDAHDQGHTLTVPRLGASRPFFPSVPIPKKSEIEPERSKTKDPDCSDDDLESELDLGTDSDEEEEEMKKKKKKKKGMMRNMLDKNATKLRRRRPRKPKKPLENRIEEFFTRIDGLRCEPKNVSKNIYLPPIGISAY